MCDGHDYRWIGACAFGVSSLDELSFRSDKLYIHGSRASRMLQSLSGGVDACVTVTIIDGLVLARSAFHHSMNYRSVVIFGRAMLVEDRDEKIAALVALSEHI